MTAIYFASTTLWCSVSASFASFHARYKKVVSLKLVGVKGNMNFHRAIHLMSLRCLVVFGSSLFIPIERDYICLSPWGFHRELSSVTGYTLGSLRHLYGAGEKKQELEVTCGCLWYPRAPHSTWATTVWAAEGTLTCRSLCQGWWIFPQTC